MNRIVFPFRRLLTLALVPAFLLAASPSLYAQWGFSSAKGRNTASVVAAFKPVVAKPSESVVRVLCDGVEIALGTIVGPDGYIVTKASDLKGKIVCKFKDGKEYAARIVGIEEQHDLAMLKVGTSGLRPIERRIATAEVGDFVASASNSALPVAIGVVSVKARKPNRFEMGPSPNSGFLGIQLGNGDKGGPTIAVVTKGSAADKAGLKTGDIVLSIAGKKMKDVETLVTTIGRYKAGTSVVLKIRRGDEEKDLKATLEKRPTDLFSRGDRMNALGSELSLKRTGFPVILQHDTVIKPKDCGGPLVDLDGKAVGINISRAGRTETYAIPTETVLALLGDLMSGKLAPKEDPDETRIAGLESALKALRADLNKGLNELKSLKGDAEDIVKKRKGIEEKVDILRKKVDRQQADLDKVRKDPTKK